MNQKQLSQNINKLQISSSATIANCEAYLATLSNKDCSALVLPSTYKHAHCGGAAALLQVITTWVRRQNPPGAELITYARTVDDDGVLKKLSESLPGLAAILMATDIRTQDGEFSVRKICYALAKQRVQYMNQADFAKTAKGKTISLLCADETSLRALRPLYASLGDGSFQVRGEADFIDLAGSLLQLANTNTHTYQFQHDEMQTIGIILKELFSNTHKYARSDTESRSYRKSVRGIHSSYHMLDENSQNAISGGFDPLDNYLYRLRLQNQGRRLLEISVFDSGPGLAAHKQKQKIDASLDLREEYNLITECFLMHESGGSTPGAGIGLTRTLECLKSRRGFLRLRSGRLSLFKEFSGATTSYLRNVDFRLEDAQLGTEGLTEMAAVSGALLTLLIPVGES